MVLLLPINAMFSYLDTHTVIISFAAFIIGVICIVILQTFHRVNRQNSILLSLVIIGFTLTVFTNGLTKTENPLKWVHFYRTASPFQYIIAPSLYFYVKFTLYPHLKFRKIDWIHFLPALLNLIEFLPFYFLNTANKTALVEYLYQNPIKLIEQKEGWLPPYFHPILKALQGMVYAIICYLILRKEKLINKTNRIHTDNIKWLNMFVGMIGIFYIILFLGLIFFYKGTPALGSFTNILIVFFLFFIAINLFFQPQVLYGIQVNNKTEAPPTISEIVTGETKKYIPSDEKIKVCKEKIEEVMTVKLLYLNRDYSLSQMANDCGVPAHHISYVVNHLFGVSFNDFINQARIDYLVAHYGSEQWKSLSLEGVSQEIGFTSRTTFINAFKKYKGETPSRFFAGIEKKND